MKKLRAPDIVVSYFASGDTQEDDRHIILHRGHGDYGNITTLNLRSGNISLYAFIGFEFYQDEDKSV